MPTPERRLRFYTGIREKGRGFLLQNAGLDQGVGQLGRRSAPCVRKLCFAGVMSFSAYQDKGLRKISL
jgi:hypothetical protein